MSKAKHTPGPWTAYPASAIGEMRHGIFAEIGQSDAEGFAICGVYGSCESRDDEMVAADMRLVAAAPDLLAACKFFDKFAAMQATKGNVIPSQLVDSIRAAIAKAEGAK